MGIKIKTLDNALFELEISPEMTVNNLKTLIEDVKYFSPQKILKEKKIL